MERGLEINSHLNSPWLEHARPRPSARLRLFCFPFVGADASIFRTWSECLPEYVEVLPVQIPGRGKRFRETPIKQLTVLKEKLFDALSPFFDRPIAFFGHSMGALVAFEFARHVQACRNQEPLCIFVSGCKPPHSKLRASRDAKPISRLSEQDFIAELARLNGTPRELLEDRDSLRAFIPVLRADFELLETAEYEHDPVLKCPIIAFCGTNDVQATPDTMQRWRELTSGTFNFNLIAGDHFFPVRCRTRFLSVLADKIACVERMIQRAS
jgi:medium-chain acyl-[acyl-carrier-protein] hydrolase